MKDVTPKTFTQSFQEFFRALEDGCRQVVRAISVMPWPALLAAALGLALILTILPLAIFVFLVFMLVKLLVSAFDRPRHLPPPGPPESHS